MIFSEEGVKADGKKIADFVDAPTPCNASEVKRKSYQICRQTEPLRRLTLKTTVFKWE